MAESGSVLIHGRYINQVGIELEGWRQGGPELFEIGGCGACVGEAGRDMFELVTVPHDDLMAAFTALNRLVLRVRGERPLFLRLKPESFGEAAIWKDHPRYNALRDALEQEVPGQRHRVDQMTLNAALQINCSGPDIHPFGPSGVFLINMINWLGPLLAALVHRRIDQGYGHLSIWQHFAREERFPQPDRWFATPEAMIDHIQSLRKLFLVEGESLTVYPEEKQDVTCPIDLSFQWWLMRPKISPEGRAYLEARYLPSMPLEQGEVCATELEQVIELLLEWFYCHNNGHGVESLQAASPAIEFLASEMNNDELAAPMDRERWISLFNNH